MARARRSLPPPESILLILNDLPRSLPAAPRAGTICDAVRGGTPMLHAVRTVRESIPPSLVGPPAGAEVSWPVRITDALPAAGDAAIREAQRCIVEAIDLDGCTLVAR